MCSHWFPDTRSERSVYSSLQMRWRWRCMRLMGRLCSSGTAPAALRRATTGAACPRLQRLQV